MVLYQGCKESWRVASAACAFISTGALHATYQLFVRGKYIRSVQGEEMCGPWKVQVSKANFARVECLDRIASLLFPKR